MAVSLKQYTIFLKITWLCFSTFKNISVSNQSNAQISENSKGKNKNKLADYLKNGCLDYSLDSNSNSNLEEKPKSINEQKKHKKQNFIVYGIGMPWVKNL